MATIFSYIRIAILASMLMTAFTCPMARAVRSSVPGSMPDLLTSQQRSNTQSDSTYPFEFHSGFWINLHHFLYEQALLRKQAASARQQTNSAANPATINQLPQAEQQLWNSALDYYTDSMIKRDLLFDDNLVAINDRLAELEAASDLSRSGLNSDLVKILESVAPVYRAHWWPQHDRVNRFWIAVATPMVRQFSRTLIEQLARAYRAKWPAGLIRVEVVEYANWAGAYTSVDDAQKPHITMCSADADNQGFSALELLFHESSHSMVGPNNGAVAEAIARECHAKNRPIPNGLWHAIIFYTAGELARRNLSEYGVSDYKPYGYRGLYARAWPNFQRPLELYWQPYLDGSVDFDKAISSLIGAL
ncbi:MAG TPA: hypothetical protein VK619_09340 [Pyrinomonadaceae bacterium]|nr:hypothetical protein [Pyrinomonadaceae bacterium]